MSNGVRLYEEITGGEAEAGARDRVPLDAANFSANALCRPFDKTQRATLGVV